MKLSLISFALLLMIWLLACQSKDNGAAADASSPPSLNPNGDTELALFMRAMYDEGERIKAALEAGHTPELQLDYQKMLTATATEPEKAASDTYHAFAQSYIQQAQALQEASREEAPAIFISMINTCMDCHTQLCPGPKRRIKKLYSSKISAMSSPE